MHNSYTNTLLVGLIVQCVFIPPKFVIVRIYPDITATGFNAENLTAIDFVTYITK